nr:hypothetical protein B0A51_06918 [Rachicladosporium sp. CCFEE 5018]
MSRSKPVAATVDPLPLSSGDSNPHSHTLASTWTQTAPIANESLLRDLEDEEDEEATAAVDYSSTSDSDADNDSRPAYSRSAPSAYSFASSYRRPSFVGTGGRGFVPFAGVSEDGVASREERRRVLEEERSLLRDNNIIPPKHPVLEGDGTGRRRSFIPRVDRKGSIPEVPSESSPLLGDSSKPYGGQGEAAVISAKWEEAVKEGKIKTTWQREAKVLASYSLPLMVTFLLQYSLTVASIFTLGHLGTVELGAVSLASMTANITGYAIYQGLATSLDTLCAQAYGSGKRKLVGLQMQRMIYFLWAITIPIGAFWFFADKLLERVVPEKRTAELAGLYLKVVLLGAPGYATFEAGKRFAQAQGLFSAALYVLLVLAPFNAAANYFLVQRFGFIGAPIAVAITDNLLPVGLFIYIRFFSKRGMSCWNGFTKKALKNWGPMVRLALPGVLMVEAEMLAFEILTFASARFGTEILAANSILSTLTGITFQLPFPLSIAASTRVANMIGATLVDAAHLTYKVAFFGALIIGVVNVTLLSALKDYIPRLFTSDEVVIRLTSAVLPLCAAFQLFDALAALCNGTLRGLGRQHFGGYVNLAAYYGIAMPVSMGLAFGLNWKLEGLWTGVAIALALVALVEGLYLYKTDWSRSVEEAKKRNAID